MKRIIPLTIIGLLLVNLLFSQKDLPTFSQYSEYFLNAGKCDDIIIRDNLAYIGCEAGLLILDIGDIENLELLSCFYTDNYVYKIFILDNTAFITIIGSLTEVYIIDIADPENPFLINSFETESFFRNESIFVKDDFLFLGMDYHGLFIYDVSDYLNPVLIKQLPDIKPADMVIIDNYIHMIANYRYYGVLDITDITDPILLCWIETNSSTLTSIDVEGDLAYVAGGSLYIFNVSNPSNPNQLVEFEINLIKDIIVNDGIAYTISEDSLYLINVTNPEIPEIIENYSYHGTSIDTDSSILAVSKDYCSDESLGVGFFSISSNHLISLDSEYISDYAKEVFIKGDHAYIANGFCGLIIMNISDPSHPVLCSKILQGQSVIEALVEEDYAYIRTPLGFQIIDISNPNQPSVLGGYNITHYYSPMANYSIGKYANYLYIGGDGYSKIYVFDISDPSNPSHIGFINVNDWSPGIGVFEDHLYVAGYWGGLEIFNIGVDPINPDRVSYYPLDFAFQVCPANNKIFVSGMLDQTTGGILMFHLPDPTNPIYTGNYTPGSTDLYYSDSYLIAPVRTHLDLNSSIQIINVQNVYSPYLEKEIYDVAANAAWYEDEIIYAVEDFKFKIFGDSLSVSIDKPPVQEPHPGIKCYPNPASDYINIRSTEEDLEKIQLINISGQIIFDGMINTKNYMLNVSDLRPGIYFIKIFTSDQVFSMKHVIK